MCAFWAYVTKTFVVFIIIIIIIIITITIVAKKIKSLQVTQRNVFDGASLYNMYFEVSLEGLKKNMQKYQKW
jgi:hypothetical protein